MEEFGVEMDKQRNAYFIAPDVIGLTKENCVKYTDNTMIIFLKNGIACTITGRYNTLYTKDWSDYFKMERQLGNQTSQLCEEAQRLIMEEKVRRRLREELK